MAISTQPFEPRNFSLLLVTAVALGLIVCGCGREAESPAPSSRISDDRVSSPDVSPSEKADPNSASPDADSPSDEATTPSDDRGSPGPTFYITQAGSGRKDGSDWSNAAPATGLPELLSEKVAPGDRVVLGSGKFPRISVPKGGAPDQLISIEGVDTGEGLPSIEGRWKETKPKYHAHSWSGLSLSDGVSHVTISGLQISGFVYGVKATNNRDVELSDLSITRCREAVSLSGLASSTIRNCQLVRYAKRGIRFKQGCHDLIVTRVVADATGGEDHWPTEAFPFGFSVEDGDGNHSIRFESCTARNNLHRGEPGKYWNGDGFLAEKNAYNLVYVNCMAFGNSDGGWDDKSLAPRLIHCVSARNKRGFRLWNVRGDREHPAKLENCLSVYNKSAGGSGSSAGLWLCGAVEAERCTFHNNATAAIAIENNGPGGKLRAVHCILSSDSKSSDKPLVLKESGTNYDALGVVQSSHGNSDEAPDFKAAAPQWDGQPPDAFNSQRYGSAKGYWYDNRVPNH